MPSKGLGIFLRERDTCLWLEAVDSGIDRGVLDQAMDGFTTSTRLDFLSLGVASIELQNDSIEQETNRMKNPDELCHVH
jgi:hypothetical protein